jgi:DNA-binding response OmpR family regulator
LLAEHHTQQFRRASITITFDNRLNEVPTWRSEVIPVSGSEQDASGRGLVLVADDEADIRELVATKLTQAGFEVIAVGDGTSALAQARSRLPSVAILDVMMPGCSGLDVMAAMAEDPATAAIPVLLLSARSQEFDVRTGLELGAFDYIIKPFSPRQLLDRVEAAVVRARL